MLTLIQIINYMINQLDYDSAEISHFFEEIEAGKLTLEELCYICDLEPWSKTIMEIANDKVPKWRSALKVVEIRSERTK